MMLVEQLEKRHEIPGTYAKEVTTVLNTVDLKVADIIKGNDSDFYNLLQSSELVHQANLRNTLHLKISKLPCRYSLDDPAALNYEGSISHSKELGTYAMLFRFPSFNWTSINRPRSEWENEDMCPFCEMPNSDNGYHISKSCSALPQELELQRRELTQFGNWRALRLGKIELEMLQLDSVTSPHVDYFVDSTLKWMQQVYRTRLNLLNNRRQPFKETRKPANNSLEDYTIEKETRMSRTSISSNCSTKTNKGSAEKIALRIHKERTTSLRRTLS
eukprot:GHVP01025636.1.p1 GENE.GHVP01025636.1~~GHVP01025636.1.p1  ORF type:complete len:274 (-),score=27.02 GHVP01025636.1:215-1036(-)